MRSSTFCTPAGRSDAAERAERVGRALGVGLQLVGVDDVVGRERRAVVELDAAAELERPHRRVGVGAPALGQHRHELQARVGDAQVLTRLAEHVEAALVGDGDRVDRRGRRDDAGLDDAAGLAGPSSHPTPGELLLELAPPHAATIAVMSGIDSPTTAPRRTNSLRLRRPAANSSMKLFSSSVLPLRMASSLRWLSSMCRVTFPWCFAIFSGSTSCRARWLVKGA